MRKRLSEFKALTFDCYGTLIDWEAGIWDALQPLLMANRQSDVTRTPALAAFAGIESRQEAETRGMPYEEILTRVHAGLAQHFGLDTTPELNAEFGRSIPLWPAFPDTAEALRYLKTRYKLMILSNVSRKGFAASNRKLGVAFDAIYTAEDIGTYKPSLANFAYMLERIEADHGIDASDVLHTAQSLFHDHAPAKSLGLANAWIDRSRLSEGGRWGATAPVERRPETDYLFFSMAEMAKAVRGCS